MIRCQAKRSQRSGLILLIVLGMLALFSLLATTFLVLSSQSRSASVAIATVKLRQPDPRALSDLVVQQLVRDTNDTRSAFFGHSLLADVYGPNPIRTTIRQLPPTVPKVLGKDANDQAFLWIALNNPGSSLALGRDAYNGRLVTFLAGPLKGNSFRILDYIGEFNNAALAYSIVIDLSTHEGGLLTGDILSGTVAVPVTKPLRGWLADHPLHLVQDAQGIPYPLLINDAAFNGVGYGLNLANGAQDVGPTINAGGTNLTIPMGLFHSYSDTAAWKLGNTNEGYDVADYRDYFLHFRELGGSLTQVQRQIPSFHRPELINYLSSLYGAPTSMTPVQVRQFIDILEFAMARPLAVNITSSTPSLRLARNPYFTGRPPNGSGQVPTLELNFDNWGQAPAYLEEKKLQAYVSQLINGEWDVDNDGDGTEESVWVDPNLPLVPAPDGRMLKVLVAPMIVDLDARLNLNTAGVLAQTDPGWEQNTSTSFTQVLDPVKRLSQGFGYGPAEISLNHILSMSAYAAGQTPFHSRNGPDIVPGAGQTFYNPDANDLISRFYERDFTAEHYHGPRAGFPSSGLPLARGGGFGLGIDRYGNPLVLRNQFSASIPDEQKNDPYEISPMKKSGSDRLFTLSELEKVLRNGDATDNQLPNRLAEVIAPIGANPPFANNIARMITTRSAELRHANLGTPSGINSPFGASLLGWLHTLYQERLTTQSSTRFPPAFDASDSPTQAQERRRRFANLFPADFRQGLRMNPNQPFGNGRDDNANGLIDEPLELENVVQEEQFPVVLANGNASVSSVPGVYGQAIGNERPRLASRQQLTRQIYCLAYLLTPLENVDLPGVQSTDPKYKQKRARMLAQWAVNIVDFRDGDSAMTRFPFDEDPFDLGSQSNLPFEWEPQPGNVVWGMEFPELQLTESLAFHDKRTKDTDQDNGTQGTKTNAAMNADDDFDQYRLPQGSLFLELYATRTTGAPDQSSLTENMPSVSPSLYLNDNGQMKLDLGKMAPPSNQYGRQPVWRVGISNVEQPGQSPNDLLRSGTVASPSLLYQSSTNSDTDGDGINDRTGSGLYYNIDDTAADLTFDRMVWFANVDPSAGGNNLPIPNLAGSSNPRVQQYPRVFFSRNTGPAYLPGGSYAVVGPRRTTYVGSQNVAASTDHLPSPQRFVLNANGFESYMLDGTRLGSAATLPANSAVKPALGITAAASRLPGWNILDNVGMGILGTGLNISEPLPIQGQPYYQLPTLSLDSTDTGGSAGSFSYPGFRDMPIDSWKDFSKTAGKTLPDQPFDEDSARNRVLLDANMQDIGTYANARTAYLQRLADPDFPYDPEDNPYITIDWISLDLSVFSGEGNEAAAPGKNPNPTFAFQTRYKDGSGANHLSQLQAGTGGNSTPPQSHGTMLFTYSTGELRTTTTYSGSPMPATQVPHFNQQLGDTKFSPAVARSSSSLGYLNLGRPLIQNPTALANYDAFGPPLTNASEPIFNGAPRETVASLFWFNRPYATPYELMLVPGVGPGELNRTATTSDRSKLYARQTNDRLRSPFGHLMNFFESSPKGAGESEFYLLMELMETPAQYADSAVVKNPASLQQPHAGGDTTSDLIRSEMLSDYFAPRNSVPSMVNPGKVNINTIPGTQIWKGVELNYLRGNDRTADPAATSNSNWPQIAASRRGYAPASNPFLVDQHPNMNPAYPTQFAGAFRPGLLGAVGPVLAGESAKDGGGNLQSTRLRNVVRKSNTLFRSDAVPSPDPIPDAAIPLMLGNNGQNLGRYRDSDKQPFIAYQRLTRLPNLVTQQSNVYAVWLTVGFFEFDIENSGIGAEFTGNRGEVTRYRSFYMIDRTAPVGFRPGEDLNTDKAILLRRFIE